MKTHVQGTLLTLAFVAGIGTTLALTHRSSSTQQTAFVHTTEPASPEPSERKVLYWFDPMYPDKHFEQPGKSPFMDMQLVPKYADAGATGTTAVRTDPWVAQNLGIRTGVAARGHLDVPVHATVRLVFDESQTSVVQARVDGYVERLMVRSPRSTVSRGDPLLTMVAPAWTAAQEEYLALLDDPLPALAEIRTASRRRLHLLGLTEDQIRTLERTGKAQSRFTLFAPRDGVVTELSVRDGETIMAGAPLMRIEGIRTLWAHADVAENLIARVHPGAMAELSLTAYPGETRIGQVITLVPTIDPLTRTQTARIQLDNPDLRLTPGMVGDVRIRGQNTTEVVSVPSEAVITTGRRAVVIVDLGEGRYQAQEVDTGTEAEGRTEIRAGIEAGTRVVLSGQFLIDSEASLVGALARLGSQSGAFQETTAGDEPSHQHKHNDHNDHSGHQKAPSP